MQALRSLGVVVCVVWSASAVAAKPGQGTLQSAPVPATSADVAPHLGKAVADFARLRPNEKLEYAYTAMKDWQFERHPDTGVLVSRWVEVGLGTRLPPQPFLFGKMTKEECQVESVRLMQQAIGGNQWGEPYLEEYYDGGYPRYYTLGMTCADLDAATAKWKADTSKVAVVP